MPALPPTPGISRDDRISDSGLQRLENLLARGGQVSDAVLAQWLRRYGEAARIILARYGRAPGATDTQLPDADPHTPKR